MCVLWVFVCMNQAPACHGPVGPSHCAGWHRDLRVPLVCHILTHFGWQLRNQCHQSMCSVCYVCVCIYTPSSATSPRGAPREASRALPHLHSSQQLGTGLTGSFSPLCMEQRSSYAEEQLGTQSVFIISYLLSATNVQGAAASLWARLAGRHSTCTRRCWW